MWLAGRLRTGGETQETAQSECGTVTIGGSAAGVLSRGEERELPAVAPGGYVWRPVSGERVLVLKGGTLGEERYIAGTLPDGERLEEIADGEVCIFSAGGASVCVRNDGSVEITGDLYVNGQRYVPPED